jgi:hypothetical protein
MQTLDSYPAAEVAEGRRRVALGASFFNEHFPGWQGRILAESRLLYMESYDYCAAAIAARHRVGPSGSLLLTHGDVCREYPGFNTLLRGCSADPGVVRSEVLVLCWIEAAQTVSPALLKRSLLRRFQDHMREARAYGAELAY